MACLMAALVAVVGPAATRAVAEPSRSRVIVIAAPGSERALETTVTGLGGRLVRRLEVIDGFVASVPSSDLSMLAADPEVASLTPDSHVTLSSSSYDPSGDPYSMRNVDDAIRASSMWGAGYTGAGVDVALIDSGVVAVDGLTASGKVLNGPDLSFESQGPNVRYLDTFGHGTHMAGIIAGRDDEAVPGSYVNDKTDFLGVAPDARIVSIKVADSHGNADVSQVIAAIDWTVQHAHDPGMNIRVMNLSFGTDGGQSYLLDPLAFAAEQAWLHGIAVVAAVGNAGNSSSGLADPAFDPFVIAAGAADHNGTRQYSQWTATAFSQAGDGTRNPDIMAPGAHLQSLRDPGSYVDQTYPGGRISDRFFRGSGSSQAAAVISGSLALMFQEHPSMTPDQAKALLKGQANALKPSSGFGPKQGNLAVRLDTVLNASVPTAVQTFAPSTGTGTLEGSRGSTHLVDHDVVLQGEQDIFGHAFNSTAIAAFEAAGNSWSGGVWNGNSWSGDSWSGNSWSGNSWSGNSWSGNSWSGNSWSGNSWSGNSWNGNSWSGNSWSGNSWSAGCWSSASWS